MEMATEAMEIEPSLPQPQVESAALEAPAPATAVVTSSTPTATPTLPGDTPPRATSTEPTPPVVVPMSEVDIEALAAKKRKMAIVADESKKRSKRMFGLLQSTLAQAKKETVKISGASKKRQEIEERLAAKLNKEKQEMEEKRRREREAKDLKLAVTRKEEEIANIEGIYRARHDAKLNLASFLCTTFALPPPPPTVDGVNLPFAPRLPHALHLTNPTASKPLYYLPNRLLPAQEDQIEDQIVAVKKGVRRDRDEWEDLKKQKLVELADAKKARDEGLDEIARLEREERQIQRREAEEAVEKNKSGSGSGCRPVDVAEGSGDTPMEAVAEAKQGVEDTAMATESTESKDTVDPLVDMGAEESIPASKGPGVEGEDELDFE